MINRIADYLNPEPAAEDIPPGAGLSLEDQDTAEAGWGVDFVRTHPGLALAGALTLGMVVAWLIKRR